jgi:hypothetical protein
LGVPDPFWASILACSFRTRSSSSFWGCKVHRSQRSPHITWGPEEWGWGPGTGLRVGWGYRLLTFHPRRSARARQPWSQSPSQDTSLWCRQEVRALAEAPAGSSPWVTGLVSCLWALGLLPPHPGQAGTSPVGFLGVKVHRTSKAYHHSQEGVHLWGGQLRAQARGQAAWAPTPAL